MTVAYYVGGTGTGKTTLMMEHAAARAAERACPILLVDSEGVIGLDKFEGATATSVQHAVDLIWRDGKHARYVPADDVEVAALARAARGGGNIVLAVDELSYWARGGALVTDLAKLYRVHRHPAVDIYGTSQYPADISPLVWNIKTDVYIFRNEGDGALERLSKECRSLTPEQIQEIPNLPDLSYVPWKSRGGSPLNSPPSG